MKLLCFPAKPTLPDDHRLVGALESFADVGSSFWSWPPFDTLNKLDSACYGIDENREYWPYRYFKGWVNFDCEDDEPEIFYCLPLFTASRTFYPVLDKIYGKFRTWRVLVVQRESTSSIEFGRLGIGEIYDSKWLDYCKDHSFTLR